ncbi:hypothetical protein PFDSM3638_07610 [Pyrococcus furiosus DSM 3638]|uniref:Uncharacterized protein n=2 Tax=Pyrococcus furiosus TaxID=2261 RepID=A0A5C0XQN0_PYRFU|nr:hypothetical protein [Pyrococcus furiosus]AFN04295.1 hypothetical protein PFC_06795 [Pyrococcus furiosus COM1]MDK2869962.1 hypothetical protein [Pyrococcus sp.]QEK79137.1 hypothetical protein PFDSM3638_07610 [Pyrococcus furiosus DSM 3638]
MGYTIYYKTNVDKWEGAIAFLSRVCKGLRWNFKIRARGDVIIIPDFKKVEILVIPKKGSGFVKTYGIEPYTTLYLLILHSLNAFGSVEIIED